MKRQKRKRQVMAVTIREETYHRLKEYRAQQEFPPAIVAVISVAVERWLDEKEEESSGNRN